MDSHLIAYLAGFFTCAAGVIVALVFNVGMSKAEALFKRFF